jgi:hypothetical protein
MPTGNLVQITWSGGINGQFFQNVMHAQWEPAAAPDPFLAAAAIGAAVTLGWLPSYLDCFPESVELSSLRVAQVAPTTGATYTQTSGVAGATGTRAAEFGVDTVGPLLNFPVTFSRVVIGKIFIPAVAEDDIEYGVLTAGLLTSLRDFQNLIIHPLHISGTVVGDLTYAVANSAHTDWKIPAAAYVSPTIGTQRRRAKPLF